MDERLVSMYRRFTWRILSNYVTPWEFEQLKAEITDYEQWCAAWSRHAATHVGRGDAALAAGRRLMEILAASFAGLNLPGYLRVPDGAGRPGIVLLLPGADS